MKVMVPVIRNNNGFIDKFIGDAILALFGSSSENAIDAAIAMHHELKEYNCERVRAGYFPVKIGIGINTGSLMLGIIGESGRMDETVIGDAVNLTSRIEKLTKKYDVPILISQNTLSGLKNPEKYHIRFIDWVKVKGKEIMLSVYEVFDTEHPELREKKIATLEIFQEAIAQYHFKQIDKAITLFQRCVEKNPEDQTAKVYLQRCEDHLDGCVEGSEALVINREWSDEFAVNIDIIDNQHKEFFRQIDKLIEAVKYEKEQGEIKKVIEFLENYTVVHFTAEKEIMRQHKYPDLTDHQGIHNKFIHDLGEIKQEIEEKTKSRPYVLLRIQILVIDWLINHICIHDHRFRKFMKDHH